MNRAIVIKTYGDNEIAGAIADGVTQMIPVVDDEYSTLKVRYAQMRDKAEIRAYGDEKRFRRARKQLARKYAVRPHGRVYNAVMGAYGLACLVVDSVYRRMSAWNRG